MFRVIRCNKIDEDTSAKPHSKSKNASMPVFIIVATKFDKLNFTILEISMGNDKIVRLKSAEEVISNVLDVQKAALVCNALQQGNIVGKMRFLFSLELVFDSIFQIWMKLVWIYLDLVKVRLDLPLIL